MSKTLIDRDADGGAASRTPVSPGEEGETASSKREQFRREALPNLDAVYRFALRLAGSEGEAEDLTQETFLRAWRAWDQYTPGTRCKSWLFTICRNYFVRQRRRSQRHDEILRENAPTHHSFPLKREPVFTGSEADDPEGDFFRRTIDDRILDAIDALPETYRSAVELSDVEGLAYEEVAEILDVPVGTVKSRLHRGRRILQEELLDYAVGTGFLEPRASAA